MKLINFIAFSALIFGTMACSSESMIDGEPSPSSEVTGVTENNAYPLAELEQSIFNSTNRVVI